MAVNVLDAVVERREIRTVPERGLVIPRFRSLRHGAPAATYNERTRGSAEIGRDLADRMLIKGWGWA
jgi:hypothetical protein